MVSSVQKGGGRKTILDHLPDDVRDEMGEENVERIGKKSKTTPPLEDGNHS